MNFLFYFPSWKPYKESINSFWHNIQSRNFYFIFPLGSFIKNLLLLPAHHTVRDFSLVFPLGGFTKNIYFFLLVPRTVGDLVWSSLSEVSWGVRYHLWSRIGWRFFVWLPRGRILAGVLDRVWYRKDIDISLLLVMKYFYFSVSDIHKELVQNRVFS